MNLRGGSESIRPYSGRIGPRPVQHASTATSTALSDFLRLRPVIDLPQRPRATSLPRVRIEGVRGSNPLSSTREIAGQRLTYSSHPTRRMGAVDHIGRNLGDRVLPDRDGQGRGIVRLVLDARPGMNGQGENLREPRSEPVVVGLAPQDVLETDEVPDSMVSEFSSLTTPYCWVIAEDAAAGYDGPSRPQSASPGLAGQSPTRQCCPEGGPTAPRRSGQSDHPAELFRRPGLARTAELGWRQPGSRLRQGQFRRLEARGPAMSTSQLQAQVEAAARSTGTCGHARRHPGRPSCPRIR